MSACRSDFRVSARRQTAKPNASTAPTAALSVAVNTPAAMPPITVDARNTTGQLILAACQRSAAVARGPMGASWGRSRV
ncbi:hypothetical protein FQZ97_796210 [compost metagenome]